MHETQRFTMPKTLSSMPLSRRLSHRVAQWVRPRAVAMANPAPVVSITFDDCPRSAVTVGAAILEAHGARGTFFVSGGLASRQWDNSAQFEPDDIARLAAAGHEIGCHTFSHPDCADIDRERLERELRLNRDWLAGVAPGLPLQSFAYPYGSVGLTAKAVAQSRFSVCRGIEPGVNHGSADLGLLKAVAIPPTATNGDWIKPWLAEAAATRGWLVLFTHDVSGTPSPFGCSPQALAETLAVIRRAGIAIQPVAEAVRTVARGVEACPRAAGAALFAT